MLPEVLLKCIDKYNEIGIFVQYNETIYWFNGKRLEFWVKNGNYSKIININNKLYVVYLEHILIYYKNKFRTIQKSQNKLVNTLLLPKRRFLINEIPYKITCDMNYNRYLYKNNKHIENYANNKECSQSTFKFNNHSQYIVALNRIYIFSPRGDNEYYDIDECKWHVFKAQTFQKEFKVYFFMNLFYIFTLNTIHIYNPIENIWYQDKKLIKL